MTVQDTSAEGIFSESGGRAGAFWDMRHINPARSIIFFSVGAALGLGIAGYGLFTAKGTVTNRVPPENVALVNQRPILRTDFIAQTEALQGQAFAQVSLPNRLKVLDDMVREELFVQRGLELDFPGTDPDTRAALVSAVEQQAVAAVTSSQPGDAELRRYFEANAATYSSEGTMTLHDFRVPPGPDALVRMSQVAEALRRGANAPDIAQQFGAKEVLPEHAGPEQFYFAQRAHLGEPVYQAALALDNGGVSAPVTAADGLHVIQMVKHTHPVALTFERARAQVLADYLKSEKKRLGAAGERYLRDKADIRIADDYAEAYEKRQWSTP